MDKAVWLISSLFDVASSQDVQFCQPQYVQYMHHGLSFVLLCVPILLSGNARCRFIWLPIAVLTIILVVRIFCSEWIDRKNAFCIVLLL